MHFFPLVGNPGVQAGSGCLAGWDTDTTELAEQPGHIQRGRRCNIKGTAALQNVR